jgi:hypothetical protein
MLPVKERAAVVLREIEGWLDRPGSEAAMFMYIMWE